MTTASTPGSPIAAAMLNPAFIAAVVARSAAGFETESGHRLMPWPLSFVVAPLVLHRSTRLELPSRISTHMATWVTRHPLMRAGFPYRAAALTEPVRAGLRFGLSHDGLLIDEGRIRSTLPDVIDRSEDDVSSVLAKARFVGRWLNKLDQPSTAFALLGITP